MTVEELTQPLTGKTDLDGLIQVANLCNLMAGEVLYRAQTTLMLEKVEDIFPKPFIVDVSPLKRIKGNKYSLCQCGSKLLRSECCLKVGG